MNYAERDELVKTLIPSFDVDRFGEVPAEPFEDIPRYVPPSIISKSFRKSNPEAV